MKAEEMKYKYGQINGKWSFLDGRRSIVVTRDRALLPYSTYCTFDDRAQLCMVEHTRRVLRSCCRFRVVEKRKDET